LQPPESISVYDNCKTTGEILTVYVQGLEAKRKRFLDLSQEGEPEHCLELIGEAKYLLFLWKQSGNNDDMFLELAKTQPAECCELLSFASKNWSYMASLAERIVDGDIDELLELSQRDN
jgi:hypothetical protein